MGAGKGKGQAKIPLVLPYKKPKEPMVLIDLGPCQKPGCSGVVQAPPGLTKRALCKTCYEAFIASTSQTLTLQDGRTVTRIPPKTPGRKDRVTIASMTIFWPDQDDDFPYSVPIFPTVITSSDYPPTTTQFAHLDSCAGMGAGGGATTTLEHQLQFIIRFMESTPRLISPFPGPKPVL